MSSRLAKKTLFGGASFLAIVPFAAMAQSEAPDEQSRTSDISTANEIVVQGQIAYRNRTDEAEPALVYDADYFQRFEPLTAGDALKRVSSVTFLSDVIESDGARLRGLPPGYTQILINGERVPGSAADRSFFLDRIPAELISSVEILRSSSARRTGDAVAGSINIILRDGYQLDGGYVRAGALYYDDKEFEPSLAAVFGGQVGPGRLLLGANLQGRHNPKVKKSVRFGDSPENNPNFATEEFDNREDQTDTRDGKDYSFNGTYEIDGATTNFKLSGFYVRTDRTETERSFEYDDPSAVNGPVPVGNLISDNDNVNQIDQENYTIDGKLSQEWSLGETSLRLGFARFSDRQRETEYQVEFEDGEDAAFEGVLSATDIVDKEFSVKLDHVFTITEEINLVIGGYLQNKERNTAIRDTDEEDEFSGLAATWDQFSNNPSELTGGLLDADLEDADGGVNEIKEDRRDLFALVEGKSGGFSWEAGIRYETTDLTITDFTGAAAVPTQSNDYGEFLPSASFKFDLTARDRIIGSIARTNRRPDFNFISPALLQEEVGDSDLQGNPQLAPETAWGFDLGYERRIGSGGIFGINVFYRKVTDLIELTTLIDPVSNAPLEGSEGPGTFVYQPQNVGDGKVYGVEFDLSTDLGFLGLADTGVFGNFSFLDSEITDFFGERRFNDQSKYVYNFGVIQDIPSAEVAFGASYRKQGAAFGRVVSEEVTTTYGADLEIFVEKRIGKSFTIRAVGSNLLNGAKSEVFNKFDNQADQLDRDFDEYELESEKAGPVFQIIARYAF